MSRYPWRNTSEDISSQTPSQWETPGGAQKKADQAEQNAKTYTDQQMDAHVGKGGTAHANAVPNGLAGFMTGEDKAKLDGVQVGANNYVHPTTHPPSIIAQDANNRFVSDAEKATWNAKATTDEATQASKGLMSAADKTKLDGVQTGAEVNQNTFSKVNDVAAKNKTDSLKIKGGIGITITTSPANNEVTVTATGNATPGPHAETHLPGGTDVIPFATDTTGGLMSDKDKKDLTATVTQLGQTTSTLNAHVDDTTKHITASERNTWNAKETPDGAQAKANQAETNAKNYAAPKEHAHDASAIISGTFVAARLPILDSVNSTSTQHAATANAVKAAYDRAEQAFTSASDGKNQVAAAITGKGVPASGSDTFPVLAQKIWQITTGVPSAKITVPASTSTITFKEAGAAGGRSEYYVVVTGLGFRARYIMIQQWPGTYAPRFRSEYVADKGSLVYTDTSDYTHFEAVQADSIPSIGSWNNPTITPDGFLMPVGQDSSHAGQDVFIVAMG
ncbi:tail fiber protein [Paenibacillus alvei]|uniref:Tail fiber protein n=1 Tax=Paenibacillus alvei TaxID=44250 RepID=A0ABT4H124_PAEAL|nr:tail fiber protein [Paenibacillus alvei]EJW14453.1 phage tail repeat-containing protein [Paenibacillus alvei DSM 29]MCY9543723.1 tail fiber protein [Paenibacillus alvei]MCY9708214.1 tail fiber protein [Paenibacillus alvei]MCY9737922.1 tail fiber protein [Paenibacillus alvei]MCY9758454.1 tail fiber protein [Paenibacillus alvei]